MKKQFNLFLVVLLFYYLVSCKCGGVSIVKSYLVNSTENSVIISTFNNGKIYEIRQIQPRQKIEVGEASGRGLWQIGKVNNIIGDSIVFRVNDKNYLLDFPTKHNVNGIAFTDPRNFINIDNYKNNFDSKTKCNWNTSSIFTFTPEIFK